MGKFRTAYGEEFSHLEGVKTIIQNCVNGAFFNLVDEFIELNEQEYSLIRAVLHDLAGTSADNNNGMKMSFYLDYVKKYDKKFKYGD